MSGHSIHHSATADGYAARCSCGWRVVHETREERDEATRNHRKQVAR